MCLSPLKGLCYLCFCIHFSVWAAPANVRVIGHGMPDVDLDNAIYEVPVQPGVSYQDLVDSLKSLSEGMNFVNPANFPIGDHMKQRGQDPQGIKEVRTFCNLSMGTEIILDHPEFLVFAPCRLAIYEKPDTHGKRQLYLGLDRPTHDLKNIKHPTARAQASAQQLENALIELMEKARRGDF
ncbi:DUF302 domain-containing protein [Methylophilus sp. 3sh_L]|jgi:uncharacterized protein (DUF302 family)|uniref:DUF302 domain-containing protein n=1 Tax=Methylophilus sp. 3sh_L TaxID=3377114 RepID=UPI00398E711E